MSTSTTTSTKLAEHPRSAPPAAGRAARRLGRTPVLALALLVVIGAAALTPNFLTLSNIVAILRNAAIVGIVAVAMTPVTLSGNFVSMAVTQVAMGAMVTFVALIGAGWPQPLAMLLVFAGTVGVGVVQGVVIAAGLNPIITTLAAGAIVFGTVSSVTHGGIVRMGEHKTTWGGGELAGVPVEVIVFLLFTALVTVLMNRTVLGRQTLLVGCNRATAEISGISFGRVTVLAFSVFSVGLALAGILSGAAFGQATANSFTGLTISVIAAVLVGGTAIQGGSGSPLRSAAGALVIAVISNMMILNDFSTGGRLAVQGGVVVAIVVFLDARRRRDVRR